MCFRYAVTFDEYTERFFIKKFKKKYSERAWQFTENAIRSACSNFDELIKTNHCDTISHHGDLRLCKLDFAVAGTGVSPKSSGNRCILVTNVSEKRVTIVLVYHKSDIVKSGNETTAWKQIVKEQFLDLSDLITL